MKTEQLGFSCTAFHCVTSGVGYKIIFGTGTKLIIETSE